MSSMEWSGSPGAVDFGVPLLSGSNLCAFAPVATVAAISPTQSVSDGGDWSYGYDKLIPEAVRSLIGEISQENVFAKKELCQV
jgi:hypothetical protein